MTDGLLERQRAIDRLHRTFLANQLATGAACGTLVEVGRLRGDRAHLPRLDLAAELMSQFMGAGFDHRVMGRPDDRAVGPIQGHRHLRRLEEEVDRVFASGPELFHP